MVSTGDNNGGTPPAEAMPEAVREAAMKVAAWLNGSKPEGMAEPAAAAYTVPAPEQLTRDVLNALVLDFKQRDSAAHAAPTLTEDHSLPHDDGISRAIATVEHEQLKAAKHAAIIDIEAAIARATDPESQAELKELLERVKDAKSSGGLRDALASASTAVANAISRAKEENSQQKIDKLWGEIEKLDKQIDERLNKVDHLKTEDERKAETDAKEAIAKAKAEEERILASKDSTPEERAAATQARIQAEATLVHAQQTFIKRIQNDPSLTPEQSKAAIEANDYLTKKLDKLAEMEIEQRRKLGEVSEEEVEKVRLKFRTMQTDLQNMTSDDLLKELSTLETRTKSILGELSKHPVKEVEIGTPVTAKSVPTQVNDTTLGSSGL